MRSQLQGWLRALVIGYLVLCAMPEAARAQTRTTKPIETPEVRKLMLRGVQSVDAYDLEKSIDTQASECSSLFLTLFCMFNKSALLFNKQYLDRDDLAADTYRIRLYYWKRGFRETQVDTIITKTGENGVTVTFDIREGPPTLIRSIRIDYDSTLLKEARVRKVTLLKSGQPLDFVKLDSMRVLFANEMWAEGYGDATVDTTVTVDRQRRLGDVHLKLIPNQPTYVGDIVVLGLDKVSRNTVLNSITLKTGERYRQSDVIESQRNLWEASLFRLARVSVPPQFDTVKRVTIEVAESELHESHAGLGITNIEFLQTEGRYTAFNLLGGARRLDLTATVGNILANQLHGRGFFIDPGDNIAGANAGKYLQPTWAASVDFRQPAFFHRPSTSAGVSAFAHRRSTPGIFIDRGYGGAVTLTDHLRIRAPLSLTYRYELNRVDASDVYFCINYGVCESSTIESLRAHQRLSPLALTGFIDRSDDPLDPTRGYLARIDMEHASGMTLSEWHYNRAYVDVAAYNHHGTSSVYAGHLRLGFVRSGGDVSDLHPKKLLYAGGASSVRGYPANQLGPRVLTIGPEKLMIPGGCTPEQIGDQSCDPNIPGLGNKEFRPQPLGGTSLIEGSIEYRMPIALRRRLSLAVFVDGAVVGSATSLSDLRSLTTGSTAITPGVGIRYKSAVGPIRVDVGFNPAREEELGVVTETLVNGERRIISLTNHKRIWKSASTLLDRFTLHFSIGQPY